MSGKWVGSLPSVHTVHPRDDPRGHGEDALRALAWALCHERSGNTQALLLRVRVAAAHVRAWRLSLPPDKQSERTPRGCLDVSDDLRYHLLDTLLNLYHAFSAANVGDHLRNAEAELRFVGKRLMKEMGQ